MEWRIEQNSNGVTISFAAEELARYLRVMDPDTPVAILRSNHSVKTDRTLVLQTGVCCKQLPKVEDPELDDAYHIDVTNGIGMIAGTNERSVLLAVYRLLRELGCRWLRPGTDGEIIPVKSLSGCSVKCAEAASYRHRGVCIEGACSFSHVANMIDWLPKIGMNGYYDQFFVPYTFYDRWYRHESNPHMQPEPVSVEQVRAMVNANTDQIKKRGMMYHATGHGWTCNPLGIEGNTWEQKDYPIPDGVQNLLAMVNGKREIYERISLNTNLCYSSKKVQDILASAIVNYCREHPEVDYLHFWLADGANNHCECENCRPLPPSDYYVKILNDVDRGLTAHGLSTKVVFLIYVDLLWEPRIERIQSQERFALMFAPITRTYTNTFVEASVEETHKLEPYIRNKLTMPKKVGENIQRLRKWQEQFQGDSFDYDYHLIWDHNLDLGGYSTARVLFEDMKNLDMLGLNGMMSCQCQRAFFPTGLSMFAMGEALWNKSSSFEDVAASYYSDLFGEHGDKMHSYFKTLSIMFDPSYLRGEKPVISKESAEQYTNIYYVINEMLPFLHNSLRKEKDPCRKKTWQALIIHGQLCIYMAGIFALRADGEKELALKQWEIAKDYILRMEPVIHDLFDIDFFVSVNSRVLEDRQLFDLEEE